MKDSARKAMFAKQNYNSSVGNLDLIKRLIDKNHRSSDFTTGELDRIKVGKQKENCKFCHTNLSGISTNFGVCDCCSQFPVMHNGYLDTSRT